MSDLRTFLEKFGRFQEAVRQKDPWLAGRITNATIGLLEVRPPLSEITPRDIVFMGPMLAGYAQRILSGESVEAVSRDVPDKAPGSSSRSRKQGDRGHGGQSGGSWDNAVRRYEGD